MATRDMATGRILSTGQRRAQSYAASAQMTKFEKKMAKRGWTKGEAQRVKRRRNTKAVEAFKAGIASRRR